MTPVDPVKVRCPECGYDEMTVTFDDLPEGAVIVLRGTTPESSRSLFDGFATLDRKDLLIIDLADPGADVAALDEEEMRRYGWVRASA